MKAGGSKALAAALNEMLENHRAERVCGRKKKMKFHVYIQIFHMI